MDSLIVGEKLESLRKCVRRIEEKRTPSAETLRQDVDRQDILTVNLTRAVQICVDLATHVLADVEETAPATMGEAFERLAHQRLIDSELCGRMKAAVGFRNVAVHSYQEIDWDIVHAITWHHLDDFLHFARSVSTYAYGDKGK